MLQRLYVDNYKCLVNFDLHLQELSLLLGPNGAGKTSVLDIVFALHRLLSGRARITDAYTFPTSTLTRWQKRDLQTFKIDVLLEAELFSYRLEVEHARSARRARIVTEELFQDQQPLFRCAKGEVKLYRDDYSEGPHYTVDWSESALARVAPPERYQRLTRFLDFIRKVMVCSFYPPSFHTESRNEEPLLQRDTRNFADWYRHVIQERPDLLPEFTNALQEIIHGFSGIRLEKVGQETRALMVVFDEGGERYELRFDELSDGQRALIVLYAMIHLIADQGYTLFLDEPDNYVALPEIQPWIRKLEYACGVAVPQAVISSHHPELIDYVGSDNSYMLQRGESGIVTVRQPETTPAEPGLKRSELIARGWDTGAGKCRSSCCAKTGSIKPSWSDSSSWWDG